MNVDIGNKMAVGGVRILDLTSQPERCTFKASPPEETSYAEAFWHSVRLQPTVESRLVSSDIKQRLVVKKKSSSVSSAQPSNESNNQLKNFFVKARTLEQIAEFSRLRRLAEGRLRDRNLLHKRREERIKKEEISRDRVATCTPRYIIKEEEDEEKKRNIGKAYSIEQMIKDIDEFEKMKSLDENLSDN